LNLDQGFTEALSAIEPIADRAPIILIDGRTGTGKTEFANNLQNELFKLLEQAPRLISMDDLYPGWGGLNEGSLYLIRQILLPLSKNQTAYWNSFDWHQQSREERLSSFAGQTPLIIEGCGSLSLASHELSDYSIWMTAPEKTRKKRFSERDNGAFDEYFEKWSAQEDEFYSTHRSAQLATLRVENP
jgi:uridine kinase